MDNAILEWLKKHWFIFTVLFAGGTAWGQAQIKISNLEDAVRKNAETQVKVEELQKQSSKIEERTVQMQIQQMKMEQLLLDIYKNQNKLIEKR